MKRSIRIQRMIAAMGIVLFVGKMLAWYLTDSVTVLNDALEGIVNVVAGLMGLYSVSLAAKPRDPNHPLGHGKAEFISSAVEGTLITIAGFIIIYEAIERLITPHKLEHLDIGLFIVGAAGLINYLMGVYAAKQGEKEGSMVLVSAGKHLMTDAYSGIAIIIGLLILKFTDNRYLWLDSAIALCFAVIIVITGYRVVRRSISGIMDETDMVQLQKVIDVLQGNRRQAWVDMHHLRVLNHSGRMHVDAHLTVPNYYTVLEAGKEIKHIDTLVKEHFGQDVEVFIQTEGCNPAQCHVCGMEHCPIRSHRFEHEEKWTLENIWREHRHGDHVHEHVA